MEHVVQFAINIDDKTIQKRVEENAYNDIVEKLLAECKETLPRDYWHGEIAWHHFVEDILDDFVKDHKDEIINAAAEKLCESYKRTKAYKEKMGDTVEKLKKQQALADRYKDAKFNGEAY